MSPKRSAALLLLALLASPSSALQPRGAAQLRAVRPALSHPAPLARCSRGLPAGRRAAPPRMSGAAEPPPAEGEVFKLYPYRWVQLGYLSLLALLSDWVCFSVAAAPATWEAAYGRDPATLIDIFLFTNVFFCLLEPAIVRRVGLRNVVVGAGTAMAVGCALRSGLPTSVALQPYSLVVAGTILVGAAQPFFQCTPPLLSATWFGADERALATAVAINFNQVCARRDAPRLRRCVRLGGHTTHVHVALPLAGGHRDGLPRGWRDGRLVRRPGLVLQPHHRRRLRRLGGCAPPVSRAAAHAADGLR
jgi:hypothetical protein